MIGTATDRRRSSGGRGVLSRLSASESGVTIIELLIAMTIFAIVASGVAVGMGSALGLTRNNRNRSVAANLAAKEMDVVRSIKFESLPISYVVRTETVDSVAYEIARDVDWVTRDGTDGVCSPPSGTSLAFLRVVVTVTWPDMQGVAPVTSETILAPPVGAYDSDTGHLSVRVRDRNAAPLVGKVVTVTGPGGTYNLTTDAAGCAFFVGLTPGNFQVSLNTANHVDGQGLQNPLQAVAITAGTITSAEFDYDQRATLSLRLVGLAGYGVPKGVGARVANTSLTLGNLGFNADANSTCSASPTTVTSNADTMVAESYSSSNFGSTAMGGTYAKTGENTRTLVNFSLPSAPSGCALETATLRLYNNTVPSSPRTIQAYQNSIAWTESVATWSNKPATTGSPETDVTGTSPGWLEFGVTSIVTSQMSGANFGFQIKDSTEGGSTGYWAGIDVREQTNDPQLLLVWGDVPPCSLTQSLAASDDARVRQDAPTNNYGNESTFRVRTENGKNERSLVKFDLPTPPSGCVLTGATLKLYAESQASGRVIDAYRVSSSWVESTVNWNTQPTTAGSPSSSNSLGASGWQNWNVLSLVQAMYSGTNYGFQLRDSSENALSSKEQRYRSSENGSSTTKPVLELVFSADQTLPAFQTVTATPLFPYLSGYHVWGGLCSDADPEGVNPAGGQPYYSGATRAAPVTTSPNVTTNADVQLKSVSILVRTAGLIPVPGAALRAYHDPDDGCPQGKTLNLGVTGLDGTARVALPYGTWRIEVSGMTPSGSWPAPTLSPLTTNPHAVTVTVN